MSVEVKNQADDFERELGIEERLEHELLRSVCAQQARLCMYYLPRLIFRRKNGCGNFGENGHHPSAWRPVTGSQGCDPSNVGSRKKEVT